MKCPSTTGAYNGVIVRCELPEGHPGQCRPDQRQKGYRNLRWDRDGQKTNDPGGLTGYRGPVLYDTCKFCKQEIEYNGTWWEKGTCRTQCPYAPKYGGTAEHEPTEEPVRPIHSQPIKPRGKSAAAIKVFGG